MAERTRALTAHDADLGLVVGAVQAAFDGDDDVAAKPVGKRPELIADGRLIQVAAYDAHGRLIGGGAAAPRGETAELMGIGVPPAHRRRASARRSPRPSSGPAATPAYAPCSSAPTTTRPPASTAAWVRGRRHRLHPRGRR